MSTSQPAQPDASRATETSRATAADHATATDANRAASRATAGNRTQTGRPPAVGDDAALTAGTYRIGRDDGTRDATWRIEAVGPVYRIGDELWVDVRARLVHPGGAVGDLPEYLSIRLGATL